MKITRRQAFALAGLTLGGVGLGYAVRDGLNGPTPRSRFKLGAILPLTGNLAYLGEPEAAALRYAVREINEQAGEDAIALTLEDGKGDPKEAVAAARKLVDINAVDLGLISTSASANAVAQVFQDAGTPLITVCSDDSIPARFSTAVNIYISLATEQRVMAEYLASRGVTSLVVLRANGQITRRAVDLLTAASGGKLRVVADLPYELTGTDFRNFAARANDDAAQAVYVCGYGVEFPPLVRALREAGVNKPIFGNYTFLSDSATKAGVDLYAGIAFTSFTTTPDEILQTSFGKGFQSEFGHRPGPFLDYLFVYEAVRLWWRTLKAGTPPTEFPQAIRNTTNESLFGALKIDQSGNADIPVAVAGYNPNGSVKLLWKK